jgi:SAM-dependent methyltransferase
VRSAGSVRPVPGMSSEIVERARRFPGVVEAELDARRAVALSGLAGRRVLDLDDPTARMLLVEAIGSPADIETTADHPAGDFDAVVSVAQLVRFPDLSAALVAIDRLLAPSGRLVAIEPVARPGTLRMVAATPFALARSTRGFHLGRDLPAAVRTTSLVIDDIERFTLRTALPTLRHFVAIDARRVDHRQETP